MTSLETKVDAIPDQVFEKMEAWQTKADVRLSEEVKKIIDVLAPEAQEPPSAPAPVAPAPVAAAPVAPAPVVVAAPSAPFSPLQGAPASSNPMLNGQAASAPKKGYGFGSGAWKK